VGLFLVLLMLSFSVFDSKGGEIADPSKHTRSWTWTGKERSKRTKGGCHMIKNNGGEMNIKIKAMVWEKKGSGIGVRGEPYVHWPQEGTRSWQGQEMSKFFQFSMKWNLNRYHCVSQLASLILPLHCILASSMALHFNWYLLLLAWSCCHQ
jgi:hypothetical protein